METIAPAALEEVTGGARQQRIASGGGKDTTNQDMSQAVSSLQSSLDSLAAKTKSDSDSSAQNMQMMQMMMQRG